VAKTYRVAIIGTGRMGGLMEDGIPPGSFSKPYAHFSAYSAIPETEVVAVANRGAERMQRFVDRFGGPAGTAFRTYLDYRELLEQERPDLVSVTTPSLARAEPIIAAANAGVKGIYAEKGLCASLEEADRIGEAVRRNGVAFNWGAMRRHHDGYRQLAGAIARGEIGQPSYAVMAFFTDLIKHHPHTLDLVSMLLGDPTPVWVEGRLADAGDPLVEGSKRPLPAFDRMAWRYVPPPGMEIGDPMVGFYRVGYSNGAEGLFLPRPGSFDVEVVGTEGRAIAWDNGQYFAVRRPGLGGQSMQETVFRPTGESPTMCTIRSLIKEIETGERTAGNIDVTLQSVEVQFALAHSHLQGGARVQVPVADRTLYIPGG
jgi:scyllo-inositol 2-dehydrogenase (NAD+)